MVDPVDDVGGLHRHSHPEVVRPIELVSNTREPVCSFGQHLVSVLRRRADDIEHVRYEVERHLGVEQVAHRVHEHDLRCSPPQWLLQCTRMDGDTEAGPGRPRVAVVLVLFGAHRFESFCQRERVAVVTARSDAVAAGDRVPGDLGPLDRATGRHSPTFHICHTQSVRHSPAWQPRHARVISVSHLLRYASR